MSRCKGFRRWDQMFTDTSEAAVVGIAFGINILSGVINTFGSKGVGTIAQINGERNHLSICEYARYLISSLVDTYRNCHSYCHSPGQGSS